MPGPARDAVLLASRDKTGGKDGDDGADGGEREDPETYRGRGRKVYSLVLGVQVVGSEIEE